ncbi:MAG: CotH kinase family protein, partial [Deltaproteobacteria bacterium]|nr:CotH kinase family protein [Deltaproteobacteria bacterium]
AAACGSDPLAPEDEPSLVDLTAPLFVPNRVLDIEITMTPADWDALRAQTRTLDSILGQNCLDEPRPRPFTYFPADITIDGEPVPMVGVRKKGFLGSLSTEKPSLKIKFSEYLSRQTYSGLKKMTLNNSQQDPSLVKQCLGYQVFRDAGVPASRCNFATVAVNGQSLGLFVHVEPLDKGFLGRNFANKYGNLYEGALSDFRPGWTGTFELKTNETLNDRSDIDAMVTALSGSNDTLLTNLSQQLDLDAFYTFWAAEVLISHWDGYAGNTNNFYVYHDPVRDRLSFIPWGIDGILFGDPNDPRPVMGTGILAYRLYGVAEAQAEYLSRLRLLLDTVWDAVDLTAEIDRMELLLAPQVEPAAAAEWTVAVQQVRDFVRTREAALNAVLDQGPPAFNEPLRDPPCLNPIGAVDASFDTTWGTLNRPDPFGDEAGATPTGSGTLAGDLNGTPWDVWRATAAAGSDPESPAAVMQTIVQLNDRNIVVVHVVVPDPGRVVPGATINLDLVDAFGVVIFGNVSTSEWSILGLLLDGEATLTDGSTTDGEPVIGGVQATLFEWGF